MHAMMFDGTARVLRDVHVLDPQPSAGQLLIDIHVCSMPHGPACDRP